jgi:hypothetical protein
MFSRLALIAYERSKVPITIYVWPERVVERPRITFPQVKSLRFCAEGGT